MLVIIINLGSSQRLHLKSRRARYLNTASVSKSLPSLASCERAHTRAHRGHQSESSHGGDRAWFVQVGGGGDGEQVRSAIEEEGKLKLTVQSDLVFITGEFEMMQSFLSVADAERIKNNAVKTWVRQLRDLAYDADDCIELVVHLDPKPIWLRRFLVKLLPCLPAVALPIDEAAAEIKQLKDRVEQVSQRNMRYNLIADFGVAKSGVQQQLDRAVATRAFDIPVEAATSRKKTGSLQVDFTELIATDMQKLGVISVWGTGGELGITSIIRKAYDDPEICKSFQYRGWAKLTHPFGPREILRSLLIQFYRNTLQNQGATNVDVNSLLKMEAMVTTQDELIKEFVKRVNNHKYLVVLEGLSTMVEWDTIRMYLPDNGNGSRIIVSTQHFDIASLCTGQPYKVSEFRKFTADHSVYVFFKEVPRGDDESKMLGDVNTLKDNPHLIGREAEEAHLVSQIHEVHRVISVWGTAGVGKSSLVRRARKRYYLENLSRMEPNWIKLMEAPSTNYVNGWVNVPHPFNLRELCHSLLHDLVSDPPQIKADAESDLARSSDPIQVCSGLLSGNHSCLIVIDDLRSPQEWDSIKQALLFGPRCCVLVVTNEASVAKHCSGKNELVCNVKGLGDNHAFQLFQEVYNKQPDVYTLDDDRTKQARLILNKCGGLPKVIVAIAGFLARNLDWEVLNTSFIHQLETNPELASVQSLFVWLDSYFHNCPDYLKPCIFYLSIFPRGQGIRRRRLVRWWIAEGYSRETDGNLAEVNGEMYFNRLVNLSMVQQPPQTAAEYGGVAGMRMALCYITDFFREYIISRRMDENHVFALEGTCSQTTRRTGRHLVIDESWDRDRNVFNKIEFSRLRSLTVFGLWKPFFTSDKMRVLRVLDLEGTEGLTDGDVKKMIRHLPRLKFLSLRGCKDISHLPDSLGRLKQLETLDVRYTAITSLPATVVQLKKLQYVRAGTSLSQSARDTASSSRACTWVPSCLFGPSGSHVGIQVPAGVGNLTGLHTLGVINACVAGLNELKELTQLRKLGVCSINRRNHKELCSVVSGHGHLESLSVWMENDKHGHLYDIAQPPQKLERLKLNGHVHRLPAWIKKLGSLRMLHLEMSVFTAQDQEDVELLQGLVHLRLSVKQLQDDKLSLAFVINSLKVLEISWSSSLCVEFKQGAIKNLTALNFRCHGSLLLEISGLEHLNCIKEVLLEGSYGGNIEEKLQEKLDGHRNTPVLKLKPVLYTTLYNRKQAS